ncbi:MAG: RNA methyltransferase [Acidobacteria bacterium]|nr:RNA methyltransferase [Acidobacteriota bacterium]
MLRQSNAARQIASRHHPLIKRIRALVRSGHLLDENEILLETPHLIEDAIRSGVTVTTVLTRADASPGVRELITTIPAGTKNYEIEPKLFPDLTSTESNPGIVALAKAPVWHQQDFFAENRTLIIIIAGIQDPGNLGTILRAAEAFGASGVVATKGTVSPYNAKAIRAAAGTLFRLPMLSNLSARQIVSLLRREKVSLLASLARGGTSLAAIDLARPVAVAVGSEGAGLPRELEQAGLRVSIPMTRHIESLNVATAASILLYEIARQRQAASERGKRD